MRWCAFDFKGLRAGYLHLEPGVLTVLAGANSSGKSSLLQSVLMVAQSLHHEGPVALNGPLARLGDAVDLVRDGASSTRISITAPPRSVVRWDDSGLPLGLEEQSEIVAEFDFRSTGDGRSLAIHRASLTKSDERSAPLELGIANARSSDIRAVTRIVRQPDAEVLHVKSVLGSSDRQLRTYVAFVGLVPIAIVKLDTKERIEAEYRRLFAPLIKSFKRLTSGSTSDRSAKDASNTYLLEREVYRMTVEMERAKDLDPSFTRLRRLIGSPSDRSDGQRWMRRLAREDLDVLVAGLSSFRSTREYVHVTIQPSLARRATPHAWEQGVLEWDLISRIEESVNALAGLGATLEDLGRQVQYLGPLRDEPRVVWTQWNEQARGLPVGARGEFSAAVLTRRATRTVSYISPRGEKLESPLNSAVNDWLAYLEIGESVSARTRGKLGVGVEVSVRGRPRDLTSVGVGVSQALPLIVAYLSVPKGSIFIVEQPELHLHPAVQARLGDFMATARPDVCTVVETHSEAFLTRIRRRVAEDTLDPSNVRITFVENDGRGAITRDLVLTKYGDLSEWPLGFMSGIDDDTEAILQANLRRIRG